MIDCVMNEWIKGVQMCDGVVQLVLSDVEVLVKWFWCGGDLRGW